MNDYFMYGLVIALAISVYLYTQEKKKNFTLQVELDLIKSRGRLGSINANLEDNRAAYKAARDKFHDELHPMHPIPPHMLEHVTGPSERPPSTDPRRPLNGSTFGPAGDGSKQ